MKPVFDNHFDNVLSDFCKSYVEVNRSVSLQNILRSSAKFLYLTGKGRFCLPMSFIFTRNRVTLSADSCERPFLI